MKQLARIIAGKYFISAPGSLLIVLMFCSLYSCVQNEVTNTDVITIDLKDYSDVDDETLLREAIIIPLEYTENSILPHSGSACCTDMGFFYRGGRSNTVIYYFDEQGKFICTIGAIGQGPGEFPYHGNIVITYKEAVFEVRSKSELYFYDLHGKFLRSIDHKFEYLGSFSWHPTNGDYYVYSPMTDYLIYRLDSENRQLTDSVFSNPKKARIGINPFNRTLEGNLLFHDPDDLHLKIFELDKTVRLKYIFNYGLNLGSYSRDGDNWEKIEAEQGIWDLRVILENKDWLYICLRSQRANDKSFSDLYHLAYHKETKKIYRLPGHLNDDTYFSFAFWLDKENFLSITISPYQIEDNSFWIDAFMRNGKSFDIEDNPIVVKIPLDHFLQ